MRNPTSEGRNRIALTAVRQPFASAPKIRKNTSKIRLRLGLA
jgi:hypothetical protein